MKLKDFLSKEYIIPHLKSENKRDVLDEMVGHVTERVDGLDREELLKLLLEREKLGSTGIGYGVAIPHARVKGLNSLIVSFARSVKGVEFQSTDDKPVHLFFIIFAPEESTTVHIKVLGRISELLKNPNFRKRLIKASSAEELYNIIMENDRKH